MRSQTAYRPVALPHRITLSALLIACLIAATGCAAESDGGGSTTAAPTKPVAFGKVDIQLGSAAVTVDYEGGIAEVALVHRIAKEGGKACVPRMTVKLSKKDETCLLTMEFEPSPAGGLLAVKGEFHAYDATLGLACADWPDASGAKDVIYKLKSGNGVLVVVKPIEAPESSKDEATIKDLTIEPKGTAKFSSGGKNIEIKFGGFGAKGDFTSKGSKTVACGVLTGASQCPDTQGLKMGNDVGEFLTRPLTLYSCDDASKYELEEHCGADAIWLTMYRRWTEKACGGECAATEKCLRQPLDAKTYRAMCLATSTKCGGCTDAAKSVCAVGKEGADKGKDACFEPVVDGDDMPLSSIMGEYAKIHSGFGANNVASIIVVAEGEQRARGACTDSGDGTLTCDGKGPAASEADCKAVRAKFSIPSEVVMLFDKEKKYWSSNSWVGPKGRSNGMLVMNGETQIVAALPDPAGGTPPTTTDVSAAITKATEGL